MTRFLDFLRDHMRSTKVIGRAIFAWGIIFGVDATRTPGAQILIVLTATTMIVVGSRLGWEDYD